jgi:hypothetical protein
MEAFIAREPLAASEYIQKFPLDLILQARTVTISRQNRETFKPRPLRDLQPFTLQAFRLLDSLHS